MNEPKHIYDWLDEPPINDAEKSAKEWLNAFCLPAIKKDHAWLDRKQVSAVYMGKRMHVSGASRMGDVWLRNKGSRNFYDHRVSVEDLSDWKCVTLPVNPYSKPTP